MEIRYGKTRDIEFSEVGVGSTFRYGGRILMKIDTIEDTEENFYMAVDLADGNLVNIWDREMVTPVNAVVTIE